VQCQRQLIEGACPVHGAAPTAPHAFAAFWEEPEAPAEAPPTRELADTARVPGPGAQLGEYRVTGLLGSGGQGLVYAVVDGAGRAHALKLLQGGEVAALEAEGRLLMKVQHPNVLRVERVVQLEAGTALLMERVVGRTLGDVLRAERRVSWARLEPWLRQALAALEAIHAQGVLHRDVKPDNLLLSDEGRVVLIDFGTARDGAAAGPVPPTRTSVVRGTLEFMSPEQLRGEALDARSDLFSLGCVAWVALRGELPWPGSAVASARARIEREAAPLRVEGLPESPRALLEALVRRERTARPASATECRWRITRASP
jgi:serine/threonine-protein kinase